jgi:hypothetical protein
LKTFDKIYNYWHQMHKTIVSLEKQQKQNIINDEIEWLG